MIAGLELPSAGRIVLGDQDVTQKRAAERDIAFVFQLFALYPHMTVRANIGFPLKCQGMSRAEIHAAVEDAARILQITHLLDLRGGLAVGARAVHLGDAAIAVPQIREDLAERELLLGVRPEDVRLRDDGAVPGEVFGAEYLGTTQVVTLSTPHGTVRARLAA